MNLYKDTCRRITRGRKERMTDAEIIDELADESNIIGRRSSGWRIS